MKTVSVKLSDKIAARLEREARRRARTKAELIRDALKLIPPACAELSSSHV
jgi:predicted transcriptional regulator